MKRASAPACMLWPPPLNHLMYFSSVTSLPISSRCRTDETSSKKMVLARRTRPSPSLARRLAAASSPDAASSAFSPRSAHSSLQQAASYHRAIRGPYRFRPSPVPFAHYGRFSYAKVFLKDSNSNLGFFCKSQFCWTMERLHGRHLVCSGALRGRVLVPR